jgi:putative transposase
MKERPYKHLAHLGSYSANPIVFLSACTYRRRPVLHNDIAHDVLLKIWARSAEANGWFVGRYILMPDHVHFFARAARDATLLADWVKLWKSLSARRMCATLKLRPPLWQEDYFDRYLRSTESYSEKWDYVVRNAIAAGLVKDVDTWPYQGEIHSLRF